MYGYLIIYGVFPHYICFIYLYVITNIENYKYNIYKYLNIKNHFRRTSGTYHSVREASSHTGDKKAWWSEESALKKRQPGSESEPQIHNLQAMQLQAS